jgi:hypothetical protein
MPKRDKLFGLDFFSGGVPTLEFFNITLDELSAISGLSVPNAGPGISRLHEVCFIGLMSYFEAFCKDHFASLINIEPSLISNLKVRNHNLDIDASRALLYFDQLNTKLGFLLAEKYDFGTAQKINALFGALLNITPFGTDDAERYSALQHDRNLLVHHGGTLTLSYMEQKRLKRDKLLRDAFFNSCVKKKKDVTNAIDFTREIAQKLVHSSQNALAKYVTENRITYRGERRKAFEYLTWQNEEP